MVCISAPAIQPAEWAIKSIINDHHLARLRHVVLSDPDGRGHIATVDSRGLLSWESVQIAVYRASKVWPSGHSRMTWRRAVVDHLRSQRQAVTHA